MTGKVIFWKALGQRRQAPLLPIPVDGADRQVEPAVGHLLDAERVHEGGRGLRVGGLEHRRGRQAHEGGPRLRVELAHDDGQIAVVQFVEGDPPALGQELAELHVVSLASSLLLGRSHVAVVDFSPGRPVEGRALEGLRVRELAPVVREDEPE